MFEDASFRSALLDMISKREKDVALATDGASRITGSCSLFAEAKR